MVCFSGEQCTVACDDSNVSQLAGVSCSMTGSL